jgi:hypothetical protein
MSKQVDLQLRLFGWYDDQVQPDTWKFRLLVKAYLLQELGGLTDDVVHRFRVEHDRIVAEEAIQRNTFRNE